MTGTGEVGFLRPTASSVRERGARMTLHIVRMQGHTYVDLRKDGKRFIFFCTLCLSPCYSDSVLFDHLNGNLHSERYAAAKVTLLQSNPWPFNDGIHFFDISSDNNYQLVVSNANPVRLLESKDNDKSLAIVSCNGNADPSKENSDCADNLSGCNMVGSNGKHFCYNGRECDLLVPGVLLKDKVSDLEVRFIGFGQIGARVFEEEGVPKRMSRIWCEWLGEKDIADEDFFTIPEHDFAVVVFKYDYDLGRKSLVDDLKYLLSSRPSTDMEDAERPKRKRKSSSDPDDVSESESNQYDSSGEHSLSANSSPSRFVLSHYDDQLLHPRYISSKSLRRELRRQQRVAAGRMCDICQHKLLPGKDVSALLNMKTERLACSSRNVNGAFHVYHTSCLINWILFCESEIYRNQLVSNLLVKPKVRRRSKRKNAAGTKSVETQIYSLFCPECQGTGMSTGGDDLERPTFPLSEMFKFKIRMGDAHKAWMKSPELLPNCSIGFKFPSETDETPQEKVFPLKLLQFYRAYM